MNDREFKVDREADPKIIAQEIQSPEGAKNENKIKIPAFLFLILTYGIVTLITYAIVSSVRQNDFNEMNKLIGDLCTTTA